MHSWHTPSGVRISMGWYSGGVVAGLLNHRLRAVKPPAWGDGRGDGKQDDVVLCGIDWIQWAEPRGILPKGLEVLFGFRVVRVFRGQDLGRGLGGQEGWSCSRGSAQGVIQLLPCSSGSTVLRFAGSGQQTLANCFGVATIPPITIRFPFLKREWHQACGAGVNFCRT